MTNVAQEPAPSAASLPGSAQTAESAPYVPPSLKNVNRNQQHLPDLPPIMPGYYREPKYREFFYKSKRLYDLKEDHRGPHLQGAAIEPAQDKMDLAAKTKAKAPSPKPNMPTYKMKLKEHARRMGKDQMSSSLYAPGQGYAAS
ncbi:unnamed protein product [Pedinophyceae sp. YPF-701]|nr:unnamed protein product [Pedinophyceae sp. YPF-701]